MAVVYADMVGYSRLIGLDDAGTLARLRTLRSALLDPAISQHGGRIVQTGGDSLLIAPGFRPEDYEHMLEGLRKVSWDSQASA